MSNVVSLRTKRKAPPKIELPNNQIAQDFITDYFYDWAVENGIDVENQSFNYDAAAIMTIIQGILARNG